MEVSSLAAESVLLSLDHGSKVGEVRRLVTSMAGRLGFDEQDQGRVALVLTEAANNAVLHGGGGEIVLRVFHGSAPGIEAIIADRGPGIADIAGALRDGYSTAGTSGSGLGAVKRLSNKFDIYSAAGTGTVLLVQVCSRTGGSSSEPKGRLENGAVCLPRAGETECGDAWAIARNGSGHALIVADGLGHGPDAAKAARQAITTFHSRLTLPPADLLGEIHLALRSTRGAAVAVAALDPIKREIRYAGVGNIAGAVVTGDETRSMVSHNGTVGHEVRKIQEFTYAWPPGALVIMHSDGLQTQWRLDRYPGLTTRAPAVIAGLLYRDFTRGRDDVTIAAVREAHANGTA
jgi:anti-sigma regulatory factor (Ser/Thr protein kinase)